MGIPSMQLLAGRVAAVAGLGPGTHNLIPIPASSGTISSTSTAYSTARAGSNLYPQGGIVSGRIGQSALYDGDADATTYDCHELLLDFNTAISSGTLSTATLKLHVLYDFSTTDFTMNVHAYDYGVSLDAGDFVAGASIPPGGAVLAASLSTSGLGTGLKTMTNSGTVLKSAVNTVGNTKLLVSSSRHAAGNVPADAVDETVYFTITSCRLELVIT